MPKEKVDLQKDKYILFEKDMKSVPGLSPVDVARTIPRPSISLTKEIVGWAEQVRRKSVSGKILCKNAAVGINRDGNVDHFWPGEGLAFLGFLIAIGDDREVAVQIRGSVVLTLLPNAKPGDKVYCYAPDGFSLVESPGSAEIGAIRYCQGDRCAVAFRRAGDSRPLNLDVSRV